MLAIATITAFKMIQYSLGMRKMGFTLFFYRLLLGFSGNRLFICDKGNGQKRKLQEPDIINHWCPVKNRISSVGYVDW